MTSPKTTPPRPRRRSSARSTPRTPPAPPIANVFSWAPESRSRFAELVALQSLFTSIPSCCNSSESVDHSTKLKEWENNTDKLPGWRLLPGRAERDVADSLAFLAAADVGTEFMSAVCVEERKGGGFIFRLAMNEGVLNEGVPGRIVDGLNAVCKELEKAASVEGQSERISREAVWQKVIDLEAPKIVKDLRLKFKRASKSLHELFLEALAQKKGLAYASRNNSEVSLLSAATQKSSGLADAGALLGSIYDQCQDVANKDGGSRDEVERLLDTCHLARRSKSFRAFLNTIEIRKQLVQLIDRLGQYKSVSHSLVAHAHKHLEAFRAIEIQTISPPIRESFALPEHSETGLATLASELCGASAEEANQKLKTLTGLSGSKLLTKYEELYLGRPSIHAEIQLVKFYEENPSINPPKFIGSSKKTCYLCNLFLERHGRFTVSKSCQNLYPRWTVPAIVCNSSADVERYEQLVQHMSKSLENFCAASLSQKERTGPRSSSVPKTPILAAQSLSNLNASLRLREPQKQRSAVGLGKENTSNSVPPRTKARPSGVPTAVSQQSIQKVQDWTVSRPATPDPASIPLPPSGRTSRVNTPVPVLRMRTPLSSPGDNGGVSLSAQPPTPTAKKPDSTSYFDAALETSIPSPRSRRPKDARLGEKRRSVMPGGLMTVSATSLDGPATGVVSMDVQISKGRNPSPPTTPDYKKALDSATTTPTTMRTTDSHAVATPSSVTSTSLPPTPTPEAREKRRLEKGKFRAISTAATTPSPRTPLGALNLTIERHATPQRSPVRVKQAHWLDEPIPVLVPETEYTIYLAGNYSEEMSLGDAVFSGKLSDVNKKGEMMQCRGFRLRSGLRKKRDTQTKKESPLRVHEVLKTSEMMVIDIIFPDAVVRMEVFWDDEARSVV